MVQFSLEKDMSKITLICFLIGPMISPLASAQITDTCSRVAIINYQEVLVDSGPTGRGEGLRYFLEKETLSSRLLNQYQEQNRPRWEYSILSTIGFASLLYGLFGPRIDSDRGIWSQNGLIISGGTLVALSYLVTRTHIYRNERLLERAIEEYNKNNTPRIYFSPYRELQGHNKGAGLSISINKNF